MNVWLFIASVLVAIASILVLGIFAIDGLEARFGDYGSLALLGLHMSTMVSIGLVGAGLTVGPRR